MFLHLSVSHSVHGGGDCLPQCMLGYTPQEQTPPLGADIPPAQCMLGDTGNKRAVRTLLECILVIHTIPSFKSISTLQLTVLTYV